MFFGSCCQMPSVGFIVFVYGDAAVLNPGLRAAEAYRGGHIGAVANFLAFVGETTYSLATIAEMPEGDHYPEYFRAVVNGIRARHDDVDVRLVDRVSQSGSGAWHEDRLRVDSPPGCRQRDIMVRSKSAALSRECVGGLLVKTARKFDVFFLGIGNAFSHSTRIASATCWLLGEAFVLSRMHVFYSLMTAPEHWQEHEKEQALSTRKMPAVDPAK
ncbi:hypothetical protein MTO96_005655 [Rhipicephalus appendiculatus]